MKISRENYESWFMDYLEGNLDESLTGDFLIFLEENPDLAEELELYDPVMLPGPDMVYPNRKKLYKQTFDRQEQFDNAAVGILEGDLDADTRQSFETYLKDHPEKLQDMALFRQTILRPEEQVVLKNKQRLFHSTRPLRISPAFLLKIAALLILVMILPVISEKSSRIPLPVTDHPVISSVNQNITEKITETIPEAGNSFASAGHETGNLGLTLPLKTAEKLNKSDLIPDEPTLLASSGRMEIPPLLSAEAKSEPYLLKTGDPELMFASVALDLLAGDSSEEIYLSDKLARKIGINDLNMGKVVRWGLSLASGLSKGKFNYSTSESGDIIALNLDTRLLGFTIPVNEK